MANQTTSINYKHPYASLKWEHLPAGGGWQDATLLSGYVSGQSTKTLELDGATTEETGHLRCALTIPDGRVTYSDLATLSATTEAPNITVGISAQTPYEGESATYGPITVTGAPTPDLLWEAETADGNNTWADADTVFGADGGQGTNTYVIANTVPGDNRDVRVTATNTQGTDVSQAALTVTPKLAFVGPEPTDKTIGVTPTPSQTIWVRPIADVGSGGDGSSYENAIGGWENLNWGTITAGDTIAIAGSFVGEATDSTVVNDLMLVHNVDGVTIDGGLNPADPARIWGVYEDKRTGAIQPNAWTLDQDGVYSQTVTTHVLESANGVYTEIELVEPNNFTRLELMASLALARAFTPTAQSAGVEGRGCYFINGSTVYVKMPDSADPAARPIYSTSTVRGYKIGDLTTTNKTFKRITQYAAEFRSKTSNAGEDMYSSLTLDTVTFDRIWCGTAINDGFVSIIGSRGVGPVHDLTVTNCVFRRGVSGIYHEASDHPFSNILIENSEFADLSNDYSDKLWSQWYDVHAIGMQHADNVVLDNNHCHDIAGNAIDFHPFGHQPDGTLLITNNLIEDISFYWDSDKGVVANGTGIVLEHGKGEVYTSPQKVTISNNLVRRVEKVGIAPGYRGPIDLFNNTVYESGWTTHPNASQGAGIFVDGNFTGAATPAQEINLRMFNNYCSARQGDYSCWITLAGNTEAEKYIDLDNNYYDDRAKVRGGGSTTSVNDYFDGRDNGTTWSEFWAGVEANEAQIRVTSSDANAASSDLAIDSSAVPMGLTPIVDTANATHAPSTDKHGNARVNAPDIGAVERQTANVAQAPDWTAPSAEDLPATLSHDGANDPLNVGPHYPAGASVTHQWQEFNDPSWDNLAGQTTDTLNVEDTSPYIGEWVVRDLATSNSLSTPSSSLTITVTGTPPPSDTAEALAVVARLKSVSGDSNMDAGEERAILDFVNSLVNGSIWAGIDEIFVLGLSEQYSTIGFKEDILAPQMSNPWSINHAGRLLGWQSQYEPGQTGDTLRSGMAIGSYANNNFVAGDAFYTFMYSAEGGWEPADGRNLRVLHSSTGSPDVGTPGTPSETLKVFDLSDNPPAGGQSYSNWFINNGLYKISSYQPAGYSLGLYPNDVFTCYDSGTGTVPTVTRNGAAFGVQDGVSTGTGTRDAAHIELCGWADSFTYRHSTFFFALGKHSAMGDYTVWNAACSQLLADIRAIP